MDVGLSRPTSRGQNELEKATWFPLIILFAALMEPMQLPGQQHHHYKFIDVGTFGGPNFFANFTGYRRKGETPSSINGLKPPEVSSETL